MRVSDVANVFITKPEGTKPLDILIQRVGSKETVGTVFLVTDSEPHCPIKNTFTVRVTKPEVLNPRYFFFLLQAMQKVGWFRARSTGTAQQFIRLEDIENIQLSPTPTIGGK